MHFTLKFLGEQSDERIEEALGAARETAQRLRPFELALGAPGAFPNRERPRILWVGASEGAAPLTELANELDAALGVRGFLRENRPFVPHATIARVKSRDGERVAARGLATFAAEVAASAGSGSSPPERIASFVLMRSETAREGARYTVVEELPLRDSR